ncbi:MAG TPA: hypothetical protein VL633_02905 [Bacteroidota bacterium]|nr:hypothetical protein [Bacteroidota bacterium]
MNPLNSKETLFVRLEFMQYFRHRRSLHVVSLLPLGVFLMSWVYPVASPYAPVLIVLIIGLELQFNNIFYRTENELEALSQFPISWERLILAKNIAAILLALLLFTLLSMFLFFFSPDAISPGHIGDALLYLSTIIFPIIHFGNEQSIQRPRRQSGLLLDDLIAALWMIVSLFLVSIPAFIFMGVVHLPILCLAYSAATVTYWLKVSLPKTAQRIENEYTLICSSL